MPICVPTVKKRFKTSGLFMNIYERNAVGIPVRATCSLAKISRKFSIQPHEREFGIVQHHFTFLRGDATNMFIQVAHYGQG